MLCFPIQKRAALQASAEKLEEGESENRRKKKSRKDVGSMTEHRGSRAEAHAQEEVMIEVLTGTPSDIMLQHMAQASAGARR